MKNNYPKIALNTGDGYEFIHPSDIIHCASEGSVTHLHLVDKQIVTVSKRLKEVGELLKDESFIRIHHSHIINLLHVERYVNGNTNHVIMSNGQILSVSRSRKSELLSRFTRL